MDDGVVLDVEEGILLRGVECPLELSLQRMQRRQHTCLRHRVHPQPIGILDASGPAIRPAFRRQQ
jgi:hypothetical protein